MTHHQHEEGKEKAQERRNGQKLGRHCGEGGIPIYGLHHGQFERLVDKYLPEIKEGLRKDYGK